VTPIALLAFYAFVVGVLAFAVVWWLGAEYGRREACWHCGAERRCPRCGAGL